MVPQLMPLSELVSMTTLWGPVPDTDLPVSLEAVHVPGFVVLPPRPVAPPVLALVPPAPPPGVPPVARPPFAVAPPPAVPPVALTTSGLPASGPPSAEAVVPPVPTVPP